MKDCAKERKHVLSKGTTFSFLARGLLEGLLVGGGHGGALRGPMGAGHGAMAEKNARMAKGQKTGFLCWTGRLKSRQRKSCLNSKEVFLHRKKNFSSTKKKKRERGLNKEMDIPRAN